MVGRRQKSRKPPGAGRLAQQIRRMKARGTSVRGANAASLNLRNVQVLKAIRKFKFFVEVVRITNCSSFF